MSSPALSGGRFRILSLVEEPNPPVGITDHGLDSAPLRLNQPEQIWTIKQSPTGYQLSIGRFHYVGVDKQERNVVFATVDKDKGVSWRITYFPSQDAYTITEENGDGWVVDGANAPDALIVANPIGGSHILPYQLYKFERVED